MDKNEFWKRLSLPTKIDELYIVTLYDSYDGNMGVCGFFITLDEAKTRAHKLYEESYTENYFGGVEVHKISSNYSNDNRCWDDMFESVYILEG